MIRLSRYLQYKTCNICFQNKFIKYNCDTCHYLICDSCYRSYLDNHFRLCPQCRQIIIHSSNHKASFFGKFKRPSIKINFSCNMFYLIVLIYFIICYFIGYGVSKNLNHVILNMLLGIVISTLGVFSLCLLHNICLYSCEEIN